MGIERQMGPRSLRAKQGVLPGVGQPWIEVTFLKRNR